MMSIQLATKTLTMSSVLLERCIRGALVDLAIRCDVRALHKTFAQRLSFAHAAMLSVGIMRKSNRAFGKFLRQPATRQFVLHCNIVSSLHCNMNSAMQHGLSRAQN